MDPTFETCLIAGDAVVLFNFRADRVIEISKAFEYENFTAFDRVRWPKTRFAGLMQYDGDLKLPAQYLVAPPAINGTSGEFLAKNGLKTFVCSETQKFGVRGTHTLRLVTSTCRFCYTNFKWFC